MAETTMKTLHVLNGDSTKSLFLKAEILGEILVWREMLCEGPALEKIDTSFWKMRAQYLHDKHQVPKEDYHKFSTTECTKHNLQDFDKIVLWFEYDLFCQVNLWAAIVYISQQGFKGNLALVNMTPFQTKTRCIGLGEIDSSHYPSLEHNAVELNQNDISLALDLWRIWCSGQHVLFDNFLQTTTTIFPLLPQAIQAYHLLLPQWENGLTQLELHIVDYISREKPTWKNVLKNVLKNYSHLGWGDSQYNHLLKQMDFMFKTIDNRIHVKEEILQDIALKKAFHISQIYGGKVR